MITVDKTAQVEAILSRAADRVGDITDPVLARYYARFPELKAAFEHHGGGNRRALEGEMVERALYCLMYWFDSPGEIEILLGGSVLHHNDTLQIAPVHYQALLEDVAEVIGETIPADEAVQREVWDELCSDLAAVIQQSATQVQPPKSTPHRVHPDQGDGVAP